MIEYIPKTNVCVGWPSKEMTSVAAKTSKRERFLALDSLVYEAPTPWQLDDVEEKLAIAW